MWLQRSKASEVVHGCSLAQINPRLRESTVLLHLYERLTSEIEKCTAFCSISITAFHSSVPRA